MFFPCIISSLACFVLSQQGGTPSSNSLLSTQTKSWNNLYQPQALAAAAAGLADISEISIETPASKYEGLLEWIKSNGAIVNENLCFQASSRGGGYGAFVTDDVAEGEILVTIPRKVCVTLDDVRSDPESGEIFETLMTQAGPGGNTVALAGIIAKERLIAQAKGVDAGKFGPYFDTLPWNRGVNNQEHMLFWSDDDIIGLLKGTMCYKEVTALRDEVDLAITVLNKIIGKSILVARGELTDTKSGFNMPWEPKQEPLKQNIEGIEQAVKGAFVCLLTRAFQDGDEDAEEEKLVPWLDMLQHSDEPNIKHIMRKDDGTVEVRAARDLKSGEELFNQYRPEEEESMPYHRFFSRYGFVPGISEDLVSLLQDKSSIFFAQTAEV